MLGLSPHYRELQERDLRLKSDAIVPRSERFRRAVQWLAEHPERTLAVIEEASRRFDLSPQDEAFLITHFLEPGRKRRNGA